MITEQSIQQLLSVVPIEDVVGDYVQLRRSGSRFKAPCPFHDEKTPSFVVSPTMGIYKCFGCQKGGNAIQFLMDVENLSFIESAKNLAARFGVTLEETGGGLDKEQYQEQQLRRESIQAAVDYAADFFQQQLHETEEGTLIAMPYFRERGFTQETIKKWQLGYSPEGWESFVQAAKAKGYKTEFLLDAGLIKARDNGTHYNLFRHRVIFPIHSVVGKVIGFGGRKMSSTDPSPKYVNSPETELYKKSDVLFGLFQAKNAIKKLDKVLLCEGYTDVITLHQSGIENVVASSGTALTPGQIKLVKRFTHDVTVIYDGDAAGIKASMRGIDLLLEENLNVRVVPLPAGEDPDSYCKSLGGEGFAQYIAQNEQTFIVFKAQLLLDEVGDDPLKKSDAIKEILRSVSLIKDSIKQRALTQQLSGICKVEEQVLIQELSKLVRKEKTRENQQLVEELAQITEAAGISMPQPTITDIHQELALFRMMLLYGDKIWREEITLFQYIKEEIKNDDIIEFLEPLGQKLHELFESLPEWPGLNYFTQHLDPEVASWAAGELAAGHDLSQAFAQNFIDVRNEEDRCLDLTTNILLHIRRKKIDRLILQKMDELKNPEADIEELLLFVEFLNEQKAVIAKALGMAVSNMWIN